MTPEIHSAPPSTPQQSLSLSLCAPDLQVCLLTLASDMRLDKPPNHIASLVLSNSKLSIPVAKRPISPFDYVWPLPRSTLRFRLPFVHDTSAT